MKNILLLFFFLLGALIAKGQNVGIGTSNPVSKLEIFNVGTGGAGTVGIGEHFRISSLAPNLVLHDQSANTDSFALHLNQNILILGKITGASSIREDIVINNLGNIGIGTTGPAQKLDVNGIIAVQGKRAIQGNDAWLRLNQSGDFTNGIYTPGFLRVDGGIVSGNLSSPGPGAISATGNGSIGGTLTVTGRTNANGGITATGSDNNFLTSTFGGHNWLPFTNGSNYLSADATYFRATDNTNTNVTITPKGTDVLTVNGGRLRVNNNFMMQDGNQANNRIMRSNNNGVASWADINTIIPSTNATNGSIVIGDIRISWGVSGSSLCNNTTKDITLSNFSSVYSAQITPVGNSSSDVAWPMIQVLNTTTLRVRAQTTNGSCMDGFHWTVIGLN